FIIKTDFLIPSLKIACPSDFPRLKNTFPPKKANHHWDELKIGIGIPNRIELSPLLWRGRGRMTMTMFSPSNSTPCPDGREVRGTFSDIWMWKTMNALLPKKLKNTGRMLTCIYEEANTLPVIYYTPDSGQNSSTIAEW